MKILLMGLGSRGDVEPFLALGELLTPRGHEVVYCFPEQYVDLVDDGNRVLPFTRKFLELIEGPAGRAIMGASTGFQKIRDYYAGYREGEPINEILFHQQAQYIEAEQPDVVVYHPKCMYPLLHRLREGGRTIMYSPVPYLVHASGEHPHIAFSKSRGAWFNKMTYALTNYGMSKKIADAQHLLPHPLHYSRSDIRRGLVTERMVFAVSPTLAPPPKSLPARVQVLGFHERQRTTNWQPDRQLLDFLDRNPKPLLVGFGSMLTPDPAALSATICRVLDEENIPAVINRAGGGLPPVEKYRNHPLIHFVDRIPYDWMMPRAGAMIHHGGSGTLHGSLLHGLPTLVFPHIIDQFMWNRRVDDLGAGPLGVPVRKLNRSWFGALTLDLLQEPSYRKRAEEIGDQMRREDFVGELLAFVLGDRAR